MNGCGCKNASRKNSCKGRPDCDLHANHPERKSKPGEQDPREWHSIFLWYPKRINGRWYWLRHVKRRWMADGFVPLCDAPAWVGWIYGGLK